MLVSQAEPDDTLREGRAVAGVAQAEGVVFLDADIGVVCAQVDALVAELDGPGLVQHGLEGLAEVGAAVGGTLSITMRCCAARVW